MRFVTEIEEPMPTERIEQLFESALNGLSCAYEILRQARRNADVLQTKIDLVQQGRQAEAIRTTIRKLHAAWWDEQEAEDEQT